MIATAHPTHSSAAAHAPARSTLELLEARQLRDALKVLLRKEQSAMADFLVALADFDRRRGWEPLGHANLFAFLHVELRLSKSAAFYRKSAAELLQLFPEVIEPLRDGRLCLSTVAELATVLTDENRDVVAPRFFGLSAREAQELVAELQPRQVPSTRMVVTRVLDRSVAPAACTARPPLMPAFPFTSAPPLGDAPPLLAFAPQSLLSAGTHPTEVPPSRVLTSDFANGGGGRLVSRRDEIEPLTADRRRVHFNVGKAVVKKLEAARDGLSHAIPGATMEQVLEAALDLLLEKQARARGLVKRPRKGMAPVATIPTRAAVPARPSHPSSRSSELTGPARGANRPPEMARGPGGTSRPSETGRTVGDTIRPAGATHAPEVTTGPVDLDGFGTAPLHRRTGPREAIPAATRRAVWARDAGRCSWPLDGGGCCGSTHRLELDHVVPWAAWGPSTVENLRVVCGRHNALAARRRFGARVIGRYASGAAAPTAGRRPA